MEMKFRDDTYSIAQHLEQIQMLYDYQTSRADRLQEALENYDKDEEIKNNRLALLVNIRELVLKIVDFTKVVLG